MRDLPVIEDPWIGRTLDERFEVLGLLGKGGMGAIYRCRETETGTELAVKIILEEYATEPEVVARFEREIQANVGVHHPNVVQTLGHGRTPEGTPYFAMELLQGSLLEDVIDDEGPLSSARVAAIGTQIALGLQAAHARGIVHRDLKPSNVIVGEDGVVKVFDFGLSLLQPEASDDPVEAKRLTEVGMRIGTPLYMAPEYIEGGDPDARSDLYALGVLLYECCTGRTPFNGPAYRVMNEHVEAAPRPIGDRVPGRHPAWLRQVVMSLLEKDPAERPQDGSIVAAALSRPPEVSRPVATVTPMVSSVPAAPRRAEPRPSPPSLGRILLPLLVVAALIWHGFGVGVGVGSDALPPGRTVATWWAAAQAAAEGANPYDAQALEEAARSAGHQGKIGRVFASPAWLAAMSWTRALPVETAWGTWLGMQEALLLAALALIGLHWRGLGRAPWAALIACTAAMGAVPTALDHGAPSLLILFLVYAAARAGDRGSGPLEAGLWLGLAGAVSLRAWLVLPFWVLRQRWSTALLVPVVFLLACLLAIPVVGLHTLTGFWTTALPDLVRADFTGLGLRIDVFGNLSPAQLFDRWIPGRTGQQLSVAALLLTWSFGAAAVAALSWIERRPTDAFGREARLAAWLLCVVGLPIYAHESGLPLALPALALCLAGLWRGRLSPGLAPPIGIAAAVLLYPLDPIRELTLVVFQPDLPWLAPLLRQAKLLALLWIAGCTALLSLSPPSRYASADE